jgi:LmbE family N-acetylglucosaminyl deacetylase/SAM-dependent methyltransferase
MGDGSKTYEESASRRVVHAATIEIPLASWLRVLDLDVGTGETSGPYLEAGAQVVGLDASVEMLADARKNDPRFHLPGHFDLNGARSLSEAGAVAGTFHVIVSSRALQFARDLGATLRELAKLLVPGGVLSFTLIPEPARSLSVQTRTHSENEVVALIEAAGLTLTSCERGLESPIDSMLVTARMPGHLETPPLALIHLDRTSCVDRARVKHVFSAPLLEGPLTTTVSQDNQAVDAQCREFERAVLARIGSRSGSHPATLPWPTLTPELSQAGAPGCDALALFAHPDDEAIYAACTLKAIAEYSPLGLSVALATSGGGGRNSLRAPLESIREEESAIAARQIGISRTSYLGLADHGKYSDATRSRPLLAGETLALWDPERALALAVEVIRQTRPRALLSFECSHDPNYSLHSHHLALGVLALIAFHQASNPRFKGSKLEPWAIQRHYAVVAPHHRGPRGFRVSVDAPWKRELLEIYRSQIFSTERIQMALRDHAAHSLGETWWLVQARDCMNGPRALPGMETHA